MRLTVGPKKAAVPCGPCEQRRQKILAFMRSIALRIGLRAHQDPRYAKLAVRAADAGSDDAGQKLIDEEIGR